MTSPREKTDPQRDLFIPALITFGIIYVLQTAFVGKFLIDWRYPSSFIFFFGFELIFIGIAYNLTESLFVLFAKPSHIPAAASIPEDPPSVAVLMTTCDDAVPSRWPLLSQQYPNYDVFILDDSKLPQQQKLVDASGFKVVRRANRQGYKAGNLNHWLGQYAEKYKYLVILDSDSALPENFIEQMVGYAEHPRNRNIAIFQSYIMPFEAPTLFAKTLGSMAAMRFYIFSRFANRTGLVLSWGHNQLLRTEALLKIGGFFEEITPEDTVLSLKLSQIGYTTRLVDVISYDTDPTDIFKFTRRNVRWAGQTAEVFLFPWRTADFRLKLLLCYHLYNYTIQNLYIFLLLLTAWLFNSKGITPQVLLQYFGGHLEHVWSWVFVLAEMTLVWSIQFILSIVISKRAGISLKVFFKHVLLATALHSFTGLPTNISVAKAFFGERMEFTPTNSSIQNPAQFRRDFIWGFLFWFFTGFTILLGAMLRNKLLLFSLNGVWILFWALAPITLLIFHRDQFWRRVE